MAEPKEKEKAEFKKILTDPAYKKSLNLTTQASIAAYLHTTPLTLNKWREQLDMESAGGSFDIKEYLGRPINKEKLAKAAFKSATKDGKTKSMETLFQMLGELDKRKGESGNREPNATDYNIIAIRTRDALRKEYSNGRGSCPLCHEREVVCTEPHINPEPEYRDSGTMAVVAVPS